MIRVFTSKTQQLGQIGEEKAVLFLMKQGFTVIERNIHNKHGEIDIFAEKEGVAYFFEVKSGKQGSWFNPADNLTKEKLWKFSRTAEYYSIGIGLKDYTLQGIVVLLSQNENREAQVDIIDLYL